MRSEFWFLIYVFAIFRLAELISTGLIFDAVRREIAKRAASGGRVWKATADLIHCPFCIGVWFSLPAASLFAITILRTKDLLQIMILWLGMAGAQYFLSCIVPPRE